MNNKIKEKYENIKNLVNIPSLRIVSVFGNPIETTNEVYLTEEKFLDIVKGMNYDSTSKEGKKLAKAFNKLQEFQSLIFEAKEKAGFGDE